jgi:uncharacterized CHY-type Zn-finger protein
LELAKDEMDKKTNLLLFFYIGLGAGIAGLTFLGIGVRIILIDREKTEFIPPQYEPDQHELISRKFYKKCRKCSSLVSFMMISKETQCPNCAEKYEVKWKNPHRADLWEGDKTLFICPNCQKTLAFIDYPRRCPFCEKSLL